MPEVIIRPDASTSSTGFDQSGANLVSRINDNNTGTFVVNTGSTSEFVVEFNNDNAYSGATINNVVVSITGNTINVKVPEADFEVRLLNAAESVLQSSTLTFTPTESTQNGAEYSTSLTPTVVNGFILTGTVETAGFILKEVFITVDYTAAVITPYIGMKSGKYKVVSGKIKI